MIYGEGYSHTGSIVDMGAMFDVVTKSGAFFSYNGAKLGQGRENAKAYLREHPEVAAEIDAKIREAVLKSLKPVAAEEIEAVEEPEEFYDDD